jgi:hypothetical protein
MAATLEEFINDFTPEEPAKLAVRRSTLARPQCEGTGTNGG